MIRVNNNVLKWIFLLIKYKINFKCNILYIFNVI